MILQLSYEEVTALNGAVERIQATGGGVAAPPAALAPLATRFPLNGDVSVESAQAQAGLLEAMDAVLDFLRRRMDRLIVEQYVGSEDAVVAYFDYANVLAIRARLKDLGREQQALEDLMGLDDDDILP